ncbi:cytochrome P450 [Xylariaceae sp. FL0594]|nr:cytochrome P450 [Xylariaceae sp. FL0594]
MANTYLFDMALATVILYPLALVVYRLYFHPLAKSPGPKIAAATDWYEAYHDLKSPGGQFMYRLKELHATYGPIVRVSPHEVHIQDSAFVDTLLVNPSQGVRDKYEPSASQAGTPLGVFGTALHNTHRRRRAALNPLFTKPCMAGVEGMIYDKVDLLINRIDRQIERDGYSELRTAFTAMTLDVVSEYSLERPLGLLEDETVAREWFATLRALAKTIPWAKQFGWIMALSRKIPFSIMKITAPRLAMVAGMHYNMEAQALEAVREQQEIGESDIGKTPRRLNPGEWHAVYRTLLQNNELPPHEKAHNRISHEAVTLIAAGGDTAASGLMMAAYFLISNGGDMLSKLREEVASLNWDDGARPSAAHLERLPYLTAIVKELLRISTLTHRLTRVAPAEPLQYKDWVIPAGAAVSITLRDISLDPEIFPEPREFRPERWLPGSNPDIDRCNRYLVPFGRGSRMCLGFNLAYAELYITLAKLFRERDFELVDTIRERDVDFTRDFLAGGTSEESRGVRVRHAKK